MQCLSESYGISGDFTSNKANNLMIVFEKCDGSVPLNNCKPKDDIQAWLNGKYLIVLENNIKFVH